MMGLLCLAVFAGQAVAGEIGFHYYLPPAWTNVGAGVYGVQKMAVGTNGVLYVGGDFTNAGGVTANAMARWDGTSWSPMGAGMPYGENGRWGVKAVAVSPNGTVYAGGPFTNTSAHSGANYIAQWTGTNWAKVGSGITDVAWTLAMATNGDLYASGWFATAGGVTVNYIGKWNGSSWSALGSGFTAYDQYAQSLAAGPNGALYAAGPFMTVGGVSAKRIAKWNGSSWSALGSGIEGDAVSTLAVAPNGDVYAGGLFTNAGGVAVHNIARWNGSSWSAVGDGLGSWVFALSFDTNGVLYAAGMFTDAGGVAASRIAKWDGANWSAVDGGFSASCAALAPAPNGDLYAAGGFVTAGSVAANGLAKLTRTLYERSGVSPMSGSWTGGYEVVIEGTGLGNGSDITNVSLCGFDVAEITHQTDTQVVVAAGRAFSVGAGDVRVYSESLGETVGSNLFTYTGPGLKVLGTNSAVIANGAAPAKAEGTIFSHLLAGRQSTHTFTLSNADGTEDTTIAGFSISSPEFSIDVLPATIASGTASNFTVTFSPPAEGNFSASLIISNNACSGSYTVRVAGAAYTFSTNIGPSAGGNVLTITNGHFGDITNVLVNGVGATIQASGASWVRIELPGAGGFVGTVDAVVQTSDHGDIFMPGVYVYNPAGVIALRPHNLPSPFLLPDDLNGTNGMRLLGTQSGGQMGIEVSGAGDVNGDGYADFLLSSPYAWVNGVREAGEAYLVYGVGNGLPLEAVMTNTWLDGVNGVILHGAPDMFARAGKSLAAAGDVNGDGLGDFLVGVPGVGEVYLVYGTGDGYPALVSLTNGWANGANGVRCYGMTVGAAAEQALAGVGDVNGDGFADFLIGSRSARPNDVTNAGAAYLVFGKASGLPASIQLSDGWSDGTNGVLLAGAQQDIYCGLAVGAAGDVNGDGFGDVLVSAPLASPAGESQAGETYLVYGRAAGQWPAMAIMTNTWLDGTHGMILAGRTASFQSGSQVGTAGDVDGDGLDDFLVGSAYVSVDGMSACGEACLVYGRTNAFPAYAILSTNWLDAVNGTIFRGRANLAKLAQGLDQAGDINGDGYADFILGAPGAHNGALNLAGEAYVVYGSSARYPALLVLTNTWMDGVNGSLLTGGAASLNVGSSVACVGDVNGDGMPDLLIGANAANAYTGEAYLVHGRAPVLPVDPPRGSVSGGYEVAIEGRYLGDGGDITRVSLCGIDAASIVSQTPSSLVVIAGSSPMPQSGDVRVWSVSFGETVKSNAFTYTLPLLDLFGTNGEAIASGEAATYEKGGRFHSIRAGSNTTHTFSITNRGSGTLHLLGWTTNGAGAAAFLPHPGTLAISTGASANITVTFAPAAPGQFDAKLVLANDSTNTAWELQVSGSAWGMDQVVGPAGGGNTITITNGSMGTITNVLVDGIAAAIVDVGDSWVTITVPANGTPGIKDIVIQTEMGDLLLPSAYTYNPAGVIETTYPPWPSPYVLTNTTFNGTNGFILAGAQESLQSGTALAAGDVNGDGFDDLLIGAPALQRAGLFTVGGAYLVYGRADGLPPLSLLTNTWMDGTNGIVLYGPQHGCNAGRSVSIVGDVNDDGYADLLIGAPQASPLGRAAAGEAYLVYGGTNLAAEIVLTNTWFTPSRGMLMMGDAASINAGISVSTAGDVNNDGFDDLLVGAYVSDPSGVTDAGSACLVYGGVSLPASVTLDDAFLNGSNGMMLVGTRPSGFVGYNLGAPGDINGDGFSDFVLSAHWFTGPGEGYLVYGQSNLPARIALTNTWADGSNGVLFSGTFGEGDLGEFAMFTGDANDDGIPDLLFGKQYAYSLVFGRADFPAHVILTNTWLEAGNGAVLSCVGRQVHKLGGAGDVNGDGCADILFGMNASGETYLLFGRTNWPASVPVTNTWMDGVNGVRLTSKTTYGCVVAGSCDFNGDHRDDLVLGNYAESSYGFNGGGAVYVISHVMPTLGVDPPVGSAGGGYAVVINGRNLGDGSDIYSVTLCGVAASLVSQSATQVVVTAGAGAGLGDVRVFSTTFGETVKSNGFEYTAPILQLTGINGDTIASGEAASVSKGSHIGYVLEGASTTRTFRIGNPGALTLNISGWTTNGATDGTWNIGSLPASLAPGATSLFTVTFSPMDAGSYTCAFHVVNDSIVTPFVFNVAGGGYRLSSATGPQAGGHVVTITNGHFGVITNVLVGGAQATLLASGDNWFQIAMPGVATPGAKDVVVQTGAGDLLLAGAYTYNRAGMIGGFATNWSEWKRSDGPAMFWNPAMAVLNDAIYLPGAEYFVTNSLYRFDGVTWTRMNDLPAKRNQMAAAAWNGALYAFGGWDSGFNNQTNVYRFDGTNWTEIAGLPQALYGYRAGVANGGMVAIAGSTTYQYNGSAWVAAPRMPIPVSLFGATEHLGDICTVGGEHNNFGTYTDQPWVYRFNGFSWLSLTNLPVARQGMAAASLNGELYAIGGRSRVTWQDYTNVYRLVGTNWEETLGLPAAINNMAAVTLGGVIYVMGHGSTNYYSYPRVDAFSGLSTNAGSWTGGYPVVISGSCLGDGGDITNVTFCGAPAAIISQSDTQVVVTVGATPLEGLGDVRVYSTSFGETVKPNGFTYIVTGPGLKVKGTNGVILASGTAASTDAGTRFPLLMKGQSVTNTFSITNNGTAMMSITGFGVSHPAFVVDPGLFTALTPGESRDFTIAFAPQTGGEITGQLVISNNSPVAQYIVNLAGSCIGLSRPSGPSTGGNEITIDNGDLSGVTNVTVGGVPVSVRSNSATSITITIPTHLPAGPYDVVLESVGGSPLVLSNAYRINLPGTVGEYIVHPAVWTNLGSGLGFWPYAVKRYDNKLYVGGQFATGGVTNLAIWDGTSWSVFGQPNGRVNAVIPSGGNLSIGGSFTAVGGVTATRIAMWNGVTWTNLDTGMNGDVRALASDGTNLYAGGDFTFAGGVEAYRVAKWNGSAWSSIGNMGGPVRALLWSDGHLYAGGDFTTAGGVGATNIARWNGTSWVNLGRGMNSTVNSLATDGTNLYAGGAFFAAGEQLAYYVALWNGTAWTNMGSGMGQQVAAVRWGNGTLYAGGSFTTAGGVSASYIAQWNGQAWTNLGSGLNSQCTALDHDGVNLYAVGGFSAAGGTPAANVAQWGSAITDRPGVEPASGGWDGGYPVTIYGSNLADPDDEITVTLCGVTATVVSVQGSTQLVVTAGASSVSGPGDVRVESETYGVTVKSNGFTYTPSGPSIMVLGTNGAAIASGSAPDAAKGTVFPRLLLGASVANRFAVTNDGTEAVVLTGFGISDSRFEISGLPATLPAGATSNFTVTFTPDMGGDFAAALVISNSGPASAYTVNLSGSCIAFSAANGPSTGGNEITITNGNLSGVTNVTVGGIPATVRTNNDNTITIIIPTNSTPGAKDVIISGLPGGDLVLSNAYTVNVPGRIGMPGAPARWTAMNNGLNGRVGAMAKSGTNLIAGGVFTTAEGQAANNLAVWNGTSWSPFPGGGTDSSVMTILQDGNDTYIGGQFITAGGITVNCVAKWDGSDWSSLGGGMTAFMMPSVSKLAGSGTNLYACGTFTNAGGVAVAGLAMWNGTTWSPLGDGLNPSMVDDITYVNGYLYACGMFTNSGATSLTRLARWNGSVWENVNPDSVFRPQKIYHDGTYLYARGFMDTPPYSSVLRRLDGGTWTDIGGGGVDTMASMGTNLCVGGSFTSMGGVTATNVATYNGSVWTGLGQGLGNNMFSVDVLFNDGTTLFAGGRFTNAGPDVIKYVAQLVPATSGESGVTPSSGSWAGGYPVTIVGENLCDGADVTQVTICGAPATSIDSQSPTQIVVTAGPSVNTNLGAVRVYSVSFGESEALNAFTYSGTPEAVLTIQSAHGVGTPAVGRYTNALGTVLTNTMASSVTLGTTQYVCTGWTMTGNDPVSGVGLEVVMSATNSAVLTWLWATNYWLEVAAGNGGTVAGGNDWVGSGVTTQLVATADEYCYFTNWTGSVLSQENPLNVLMDSAKTITANFAPHTTSNGVPIPWFIRYGISNNFEEAATNDPDHDGIPTGEEYPADTDPTNSESFFSAGEFGPIYGTNCNPVVWTNTVPPYDVATQIVCDVVGYGLTIPVSTGRIYDLQYDLAVPAGAWAPVPGRTNMVPASGTLVITNMVDENRLKFYRLKVRLP